MRLVRVLQAGEVARVVDVEGAYESAVLNREAPAAYLFRTGYSVFCRFLF